MGVRLTAAGLVVTLKVELAPDARRRPIDDRGVAEHEPVAVAQRAAPDDPLAVHERAVARQAVVDQHPVRADALELRVQPRDLAIPGERHVAVRSAADGDLPVELVQDLVAGAVEVEQERHAAPLGLQARLELGRGGPVQLGHAPPARRRSASCCASCSTICTLPGICCRRTSFSRRSISAISSATRTTGPSPTASLERSREGRRGLVALARVLGQRPGHDRVDFRRDPGRRRRRGQVCPQLALGLVEREDDMAREREEQDAAERVDVGPGSRLAALDPLRRDVVERPEHLARPRDPGGGGEVLDQPEVGQVRVVVGGQQDVGGLDVAMHEPARVGGGQRGGHLADHGGGARRDRAARRGRRACAGRRR